jgi:hypothetical protein
VAEGELEQILKGMTFISFYAKRNEAKKSTKGTQEADAVLCLVPSTTLLFPLDLFLSTCLSSYGLTGGSM